MVLHTIKWPQIQKRLILAIMLFLACIMSYMMRVNLSINIIAMVQPKNSTEVVPDFGPRYYWTQNDQALLLSAYFYGYMITSFPAGMLAENFGGRDVIGWSCLLSGFLTAITPQIAGWDKWALFSLRFIIGVLNGVVYPTCHNLVSKWAPADEKGKFIASLMGGTFATVVTWPISGVVIEKLGWYWAFYMSGLFVVIVSIMWLYLVADNPAKHKTISVYEREYIEKSLGTTISNQKKWPPFKRMLLSLPYLSLVLLHFGSMWGFVLLITATPKFLSEVLGFNLSSAGFLASLPHLVRVFSAFGFGALADLIRRKNWLSVTALRKVFCFPSHILSGLLLIVLAYYGRDPYVCVAIMTFSFAVNGAATVTNLANSQDLAPNFAGTLYGILTSVGTTPGFFSPLIVAHFTEGNNTIAGWHWVFIIAACAYIIPALVFWIFGSGEIQKWNELEKHTNGDDTINTKL